ncbi:unnamed protein product [Blumeria hordei]|uniref:Uncharacterized protein n=1 Tax=Blumeria hordei TaxID=2867405 RepID=A0A383UTB5_BLUHO|nr:unnamed protein product [Blumeria hordei]
MFRSIIYFSVLAAVIEARFSQSQDSEDILKITKLADLGQPGDATKLGSDGLQSLLITANPCDKLRVADKIVVTLGDSDRSIAAARGLVAAEQDSDPQEAGGPPLCGDAALPVTQSLRGIVPLVDPTITGQEIENANAALSVKTPFDAKGKSVADVAITQGFSNFRVARAGGVSVSASKLSDRSSETAAAEADENDSLTTPPTNSAKLSARKSKSKVGAGFKALKAVAPVIPFLPLIPAAVSGKDAAAAATTDTATADTKAADTKAADTKAADTKTADTKTADKKSSDKKAEGS